MALEDVKVNDTQVRRSRGKERLARIYQAVAMAGIDPIRFVHAMRGLPAFFRDWRTYSRQDHEGFPLSVATAFPCLADRTAEAGTVGGHYFHMDLWAARKVAERRPARHVDVGSRLDGFVAHLLTIMPVDVVDVRPIRSEVAGLNFVQSDATQMAEFASDSLPSLSCLHAAEHFGLGRYSDPVDAGAPFRLMAALTRVLAPGGRLLFAVPVGRQRLEFNAHRIFWPETVIAGFATLELVSFSYVDDSGALVENVSPAEARDCSYGCGLFEFSK